MKVSMRSTGSEPLCILSLLVLGLLLLGPGPAFADLDQAQLLIEPPQPVEGDSVAVTAFGQLDDGCWDPVVSYDCSRVGNQIEIRFHTVDHWTAGTTCLTLVTAFEGRCDLGPLAEGIYTVHVVEERQSVRFPLPDMADFELVVTGPVATEFARWSTLKAGYAHGSEDRN